MDCYTVIYLFGVTLEGHSVMVRVHGFSPYFYVQQNGSGPEAVLYRLSQKLRRRHVAGVDVEEISAVSLFGIQAGVELFHKITVPTPHLVYTAREALREEGFEQSFESNVDVITRFMVDTKLTGCCWVELRGRYQIVRESISRCQIEVVTSIDSLVPLLPVSVVPRLPAPSENNTSSGFSATNVNTRKCRQMLANACAAKTRAPKLRAAESEAAASRNAKSHTPESHTHTAANPANYDSTVPSVVQETGLLPSSLVPKNLCAAQRQQPTQKADTGTRTDTCAKNSEAAEERCSENFGNSHAPESSKIEACTSNVRSPEARCPQARCWNDTAPLRVMSFDIEVSGRKGIFPEPEADPVIQVASVVHVHGHKDPLCRNVYVVGSCAPLPAVDVIECKDEGDLLTRWAAFVRRADPDVLTGYNIDNFDFPYLLERAKLLQVPSLAAIGRVKNSDARSHVRSSGISRFAEQATTTVPGRVVMDMFSVAKKEHKLRSYSLNAVAKQFLGESKDDVHYSQISELHAGDATTRSKLAAYCLQDAQLPLKLMQKWMTLTNCVEMARVTGLPLRVVVSRGQQVRVFAQILREARSANVLVPTIMRHEAIPYAGGLVLEPEKGFHSEPIAVLDFSSLYPSIMIAYNLCYSTLLTDATSVGKSSSPILHDSPEKPKSTADTVESFCKVPKKPKSIRKGEPLVEPQPLIEHQPPIEAQSLTEVQQPTETQFRSDTHSTCITRSHGSYSQSATDSLETKTAQSAEIRVNRTPANLSPATRIPANCRRVNRTPTGAVFVAREERKGLLPKILENLIEQRAQTRKLLKQESDPDVRRVYNGRQLAFKVLANAVYGFTGAQKGMLPCVQISESVTAYGRKIIDRARALVEKRFNVSAGYTKNARVVYGDTDSVMIAFGADSVEQAVARGREAAAYVTREINMPPLKLEFEKVFSPFLLVSKKRYVGLAFADETSAGIVESKGIETERRDNCQLVSDLVSSCLRKLMVEKDANGAVEECRSVFADLAANRVDISKLVISKELTSKEYRVRLPHTELAKRIQARTPGAEPKLGDRVPYVILAGKRSSPLHTRAENPDFAAQNNLQLDVSYYLERQLFNPIARILGPIVGDQEIRNLLLAKKHQKRAAKIQKRPANARVQKTKCTQAKQAKLEAFGFRVVKQSASKRSSHNSKSDQDAEDVSRAVSKPCCSKCNILN